MVELDAEFGTITCRKLVVRYDGSPFASKINPLYVKVSVYWRRECEARLLRHERGSFLARRAKVRRM